MNVPIYAAPCPKCANRNLLWQVNQEIEKMGLPPIKHGTITTGQSGSIHLVIAPWKPAPRTEGDGT